MSADPITGASDVVSFRQSLASVKWFSKVGTPTDYPHCIDAWDSWPGPMEPTVEAMHVREQEMHDKILETVKPQAKELETLFKEVTEQVLQLASPTVPFDADEDAWHAPTTAVWGAAWTAALVALHLEAGLAIPDELCERWRWHVEGRWPCGYVSGQNSSEFVIY